jgi:16S rRNA processing protein RimM
MSDSRRVVIGRIAGAHGLRGVLQVRYSGDGPENLFRAEKVMVGRRADDAQAISMEVESVTPGRSSEVRMALVGVEGREAAEALRGRVLMVEVGQLDPLAEGEYYEFQLIGCRVEGTDGEQVGTVREVWSTGASDVLIVVNEEGAQHLIPTGGNFLREVDLERRRIVVEIIPGLLDAS